VLYREQDLNKAKATVAERRLKEGNSFALLESQVKVVSAHNVFRLASGCHLILDATNQAAASRILHQAAAQLRIPLVHARTRGWAGGLTTFFPGLEPCPVDALPETCPDEPPAPAALLSPLPGILGALQTLEAMRILGGQAPSLSGRVLYFDGNNLHFTDKF
jgi:molybdopterin/thiamine biosynthesis adenylyltransferase